jgi:two-component system chemotaxis response regulator CheB
MKSRKPVPVAEVVPIGCPGCAGVLERIARSDRYADYVCRVGHSYSLAELLRAKEQQAETALWSAIAVLEHVERVIEWMPAGGNPGATAEGLAARLAQVRAQQVEIRRLIDQTLLPGTDDEAPDSSGAP